MPVFWGICPGEVIRIIQNKGNRSLIHCLSEDTPDRKTKISYHNNSSVKKSEKWIYKMPCTQECWGSSVS